MTEIIQPPVKVKIGGLWKNESKTGIVYYSGELSYNTRLEIWPNKKRDGIKDPDFNLFITEKLKKSAPPSDIPDFPDANNVPF